MPTVTTFGEIMLRLSTKGYQRLVQATELQLNYGGAEANVAVSLSWLGMDSQFVTRLPDNALGYACLQSLHQYAIDTKFIDISGERLGTYYLETGAAQRNASVLYDRANSAFSLASLDTFDWEKILSQTDWFHWSGITPALTENAYQVTQQAMEIAAKKDVMVSCDLNYRGKLWNWGTPPDQIMPGLIENCGLLIAGMYDAQVMLGISVEAEGDTYQQHEAMFEAIHQKYPTIQTIATTLRSDTTSSKTTIQGIMWHQGKIYTSVAHKISHIVDRVGAGDAFSAGLIHGFLKEKEPQSIIDFAAAAACLKHSVVGDANLVSESEILALATGGATGRVSR